MAQTVKLKRSAVAAKVPLTTDLALGELAVNTNDGALYTLINDGTNKIVQLGGQSVTATVTAGTNAQGQGALTSNVNVVTTTAANPSGVTLPTALLGRKIIVHNRGTNPINVYPASGAQIDAAGTNVSLQVPVNGRVEFNATSTTQWYSSFPSTLISPTITSAALSGALTVGGSTGTSGQALVSTGASTPAWTTLTLENLPDAWVKRAVKAATTADLAAASSTATTLTGTLVVFPAQDGISFAVGDRLLVKNQTTAAQNGIYTLTTAGVAGTTAWVLTRATDADTASELAGATVSVDQGTTQGGFIYDTNFKTTDTVGTTACNFSRILDTGAVSGDATVANSGALTIANSAVTFAKMQNSAAAGLSVIGRSANSAGVFAEIAAGTDGHVLYRASSTSLTFGQLPTASIANSAITYAKIQNVSATDRLLGRSTAGAGVIEEITCTAAGRALLDDADAAAQRTTLGLGTIATQASSSVSITGGSVTGITDITLADGGTNASLTAVNGGVVWSNATQLQISAAGSSGQFLKSNGAAAPTWTTLEMTDIPGAVYKKSVKAATTADLGTVTYANGTAGVGATLTGPTGASAVVFPAQDGVTIALNDRILVKNQTTAAQNGIYTLTTVGVAGTTAWVLTRATDADTNVEIGSAVVAVDQGTANGGEFWTTNFKSTDTVGTTAMAWNEVIYNNFSSPTFSGTLTTGSTITAGNTPISIYPGNTTTNITIGSGLTTGTFTAGATGSTGAVSLFPATGGQAITLGGATTGTITIGSTSATAVQLPTGKTKIGTSFLAQGSAFTYTLPTVAANATLAVSTGNLSQFAATTSAQLAGVISDETGSGALVFGTSPAFTTSITTGSTSFDLINTTATTVNAFGAATSLNLGYGSTATSTTNICNGTSSAGTKTINIGTAGTGTEPTTGTFITLGTSASSTVFSQIDLKGAVEIHSSDRSSRGPISALSTTSAGSGFKDGVFTLTNSVGMVLTIAFGGGTVRNTYLVGAGYGYSRGDVITYNHGSSVTSGGSGNGTTATLNIPAGATANTSAASGTGTVATLTFPVATYAPFPVGSTIVVSGVTPAGYNGTYTVTACTTTTVSYANATTGAQTVGGTISIVPYIVGSTIVVSGATPAGYNGTYVVTASTPNTVSYANTTTGAITINPTISTSGTAAQFQVTSTIQAALYLTNLSTTTPSSRVRLENSNTTISANDELGSIIFSSQDNTFSSSAGSAGGDRAIVRGTSQGPLGETSIDFLTSAAYGTPTLCASFGSNKDFRLYNNAGDGYHRFVNNPASAAVRSVNLPDADITFANAFTTSGAFPLTLTTTASTNVTLPTTGTLATLGGAETFSGVKTFTANPRLNDLIKLEVGTGADLSLYHDGSNNYIDITLGNLIIRDGATQRVLFERTTGSLALGGVATPTAKLHLPAGVATAGGAPLKIDSGVVLTTPEADALEYDGVLLYHTQNDATNGNKRAIIPEFQYIRRSTDVSITATASPGTSIFGATLRPALVAGRVYEVEAVIFARKDTSNGTVTIQAALSAGTFTFCSLQCNNAATSVAVNQTASPTNVVTTATITQNTQFGVTIRGLVVAASNARLNLLAYATPAAVTIFSSSFMKITCLGTETSSGNFG